MKDMEGQMGNFPNTCLLAFKELLIKDWKTTYLHLPQKIMSYASERYLYGYCYYCIMEDVTAAISYGN
jgi:hypothetical protein